MADVSLATRSPEVFAVLLSLNTIVAWILSPIVTMAAKCLEGLQFYYWLSISHSFFLADLFNFCLTFLLKLIALGPSQEMIITVSSTIAAHTRPEITQKMRRDGRGLNSFRFMPKC